MEEEEDLFFLSLSFFPSSICCCAVQKKKRKEGERWQQPPSNITNLYSLANLKEYLLFLLSTKIPDRLPTHPMVQTISLGCIHFGFGTAVPRRRPNAERGPTGTGVVSRIRHIYPRQFLSYKC